jgi:O-antigen/teichoic acid export membrane protein
MENNINTILGVENHIITILSFIVSIAALAIPFVVPKKHQKYAVIGTLVLISIIALCNIFSPDLLYVLFGLLLILSLAFNFIFYKRQVFLKNLVRFFQKKNQKKNLLK